MLLRPDKRPGPEPAAANRGGPIGPPLGSPRAAPDRETRWQSTAAISPAPVPAPGRADESARVLKSILREAPTLAEALLLSARIDLTEGRFDAAERSLRQILERDPHEVAARYQLGLVQRQAGDISGFEESMRLKDETQALIDRMIDLNQKVIDNPGDSELCQQISDVCQKLGKDKLAKTWQKAAEGLRSGER